MYADYLVSEMTYNVFVGMLNPTHSAVANGGKVQPSVFLLVCIKQGIHPCCEVSHQNLLLN